MLGHNDITEEGLLRDARDSTSGLNTFSEAPFDHITAGAFLNIPQMADRLEKLWDIARKEMLQGQTSGLLSTEIFKTELR